MVNRDARRPGRLLLLTLAGTLATPILLTAGPGPLIVGPDASPGVLAYAPLTGVWLRASVDPGGSGRPRIQTGQWRTGATVLTLRANGDLVADALIYDPDTGDWTLALATGSGYALTHGRWARGWQAHRGDFNGDGHDDVLLYDRRTGAVTEYRGDGRGGFQGTVFPAAAGQDLLIADCTGDGRSDVVAYNADTGAFTLYVADPVAGALLPHRSGVWARGLKMMAANWNGNRLADLLLYDQVSGLSVRVVSTPDASFVYHMTTWAPGLDVEIADFDGDGATDALLYDAFTGDWTLMDGRHADDRLGSGRLASGLRVHATQFDGAGPADVLLYQRETGQWSIATVFGGHLAERLTGVWSPGALVTARLGERLEAPLQGPLQVVHGPVLAPPPPGNEPAPPLPAPVTIVATPKIVAFGDSITAGTHSSSFSTVFEPTHVSYPATVEADLRARYPRQSSIRVTNSGLPGERAVDGKDRIGQVLDSVQPDLVLILEGVNDINSGIPNTQIAAALRQMIERAAVRRVRVLLCKLTPVTAAFDPVGSTRAWIDDLNDRIEALATQFGIGPPIDLHDPLVDDTSIAADGLHPSDSGYTKMGQIVTGEIRGRFETRARPILQNTLDPTP